MALLGRQTNSRTLGRREPSSTTKDSAFYRDPVKRQQQETGNQIASLRNQGFNVTQEGNTIIAKAQPQQYKSYSAGKNSEYGSYIPVIIKFENGRKVSEIYQSPQGGKSKNIYPTSIKTYNSDGSYTQQNYSFFGKYTNKLASTTKYNAQGGVISSERRDLSRLKALDRQDRQKSEGKTDEQLLNDYKRKYPSSSEELIKRRIEADKLKASQPQQTAREKQIEKIRQYETAASIARQPKIIETRKGVVTNTSRGFESLVGTTLDSNTRKKITTGKITPTQIKRAASMTTDEQKKRYGTVIFKTASKEELGYTSQKELRSAQNRQQQNINNLFNPRTAYGGNAIVPTTSKNINTKVTYTSILRAGFIPTTYANDMTSSQRNNAVRVTNGMVMNTKPVISDSKLKNTYNNQKNKVKNKVINVKNTVTNKIKNLKNKVVVTWKNNVKDSTTVQKEFTKDRNDIIAKESKPYESELDKAVKEETQQNEDIIRITGNVQQVKYNKKTQDMQNKVNNGIISVEVANAELLRYGLTLDKNLNGLANDLIKDSQQRIDTLAKSFDSKLQGDVNIKLREAGLLGKVSRKGEFVTNSKGEIVPTTGIFIARKIPKIKEFMDRRLAQGDKLASEFVRNEVKDYNKIYETEVAKINQSNISNATKEQKKTMLYQKWSAKLATSLDKYDKNYNLANKDARRQIREIDAIRLQYQLGGASGNIDKIATAGAVAYAVSTITTAAAITNPVGITLLTVGGLLLMGSWALAKSSEIKNAPTEKLKQMAIGTTVAETGAMFVGGYAGARTGRNIRGRIIEKNLRTGTIDNVNVKVVKSGNTYNIKRTGTIKVKGQSVKFTETMKLVKDPKNPALFNKLLKQIKSSNKIVDGSGKVLNNNIMRKFSARSTVKYELPNGKTKSIELRYKGREGVTQKLGKQQITKEGAMDFSTQNVLRMTGKVKGKGVNQKYISFGEGNQVNTISSGKGGSRLFSSKIKNLKNPNKSVTTFQLEVYTKSIPKQKISGTLMKTIKSNLKLLKTKKLTVKQIKNIYNNTNILIKSLNKLKVKGTSILSKTLNSVYNSKLMRSKKGSLSISRPDGGMGIMPKGISKSQASASDRVLQQAQQLLKSLDKKVVQAKALKTPSAYNNLLKSYKDAVQLKQLLSNEFGGLLGGAKNVFLPKMMVLPFGIPSALNNIRLSIEAKVNTLTTGIPRIGVEALPSVNTETLTGAIPSAIATTVSDYISTTGITPAVGNPANLFDPITPFIPNRFIPFGGGIPAFPSSPMGGRGGYGGFDPTKQRNFVYLSDLTARIEGQKATASERADLLRVGRTFTGLERRKRV